MKIKSKTDVITNSSTEVFICGPKEGITFEELKKKIPFFRLIQFSYDRYKEWVKSLKDAMKKAEESEEEDWVYEDSYQASGSRMMKTVCTRKYGALALILLTRIKSTGIHS